MTFVAQDGDNTADVLQSAIDRIDADLSSTRSGDGSGTVNVNVAVLDTGIGLGQTDLNVAGGVDCYSNEGHLR